MRSTSSPLGLAPLKTAPPVVLAVHLDQEVRPDLEEAAAANGLRVLSVRHLQAACAALASKDIALVLADEATRPWDREVLLEHASKHGAAVLWMDPCVAPDFIQDALQAVFEARGQAPHWRSGARAS